MHIQPGPGQLVNLLKRIDPTGDGDLIGCRRLQALHLNQVDPLHHPLPLHAGKEKFRGVRGQCPGGFIEIDTGLMPPAAGDDRLLPGVDRNNDLLRGERLI